MPTLPIDFQLGVGENLAVAGTMKTSHTANAVAFLARKAPDSESGCRTDVTDIAFLIDFIAMRGSSPANPPL